MVQGQNRTALNSSFSQPAIENRKSNIQNWHIVAASVTGVSHEKATLPCQDAYAFHQLPNSVLICAVADGAGLPPYRKSVRVSPFR